MYLRDEYMKRIENSRIDIYGLIWYVIKKWKSILLMSAIFFVLVSLVAIPRYNKKSAAQDSNVAETLSEEEKLRVDSTLRLYSELEEMDEYKSKSMYMNLNAYECHIGTLQYRVNEKHLSTYESFIKDGGLKKIVEEEFGSEVVRPSDLVIIPDNNMMPGNSNNRDDDIVNDHNLCIKVTTDNEELTERMMSVVKSSVAEYQKKLTGLIGTQELTLLSEDMYVGVDENVKVGQSNFEIELDRKRTHVFNLENKLTSTEKAALNSIKNNGGIVENTEQKTKSIPIVLLAAIVFLSVVFSCLVIACYYILNNKIKSGKDMVTYFDIPYLGEISKNSKKAELDILETEIEFLSSERDIETFFFGLVGRMKNAESCLEALKADLTEKKIGCILGKNVESDIASMKAVKECKNIIIVFGIDQTSYDAIDTLLQKCMNWKINVVGAIGINNY